MVLAARKQICGSSGPPVAPLHPRRATMAPVPTGKHQGPLRLLLAAALLTALTAAPGLAADDKPIAVLVVPVDPQDGPDFFVSDGPLDAKRVGTAMWKGVRWLKRKQADNGSWGGMRGDASYGGIGAGSPGALYPAGPTALALYTLLRARVPVRDRVIRAGFQYLAKHHKRPRSSLEMSMVLLAVTATADFALRSKAGKRLRPKVPGVYRAWATRLAEQLVAKRTARGWRYNYPGQQAAPGGPEDLASTHLAALALFTAQRLGIKTADRVWEDILAFTLEQQADSGSRETFVDPTDPTKKIHTRERGFAYIRGQEEPDDGKPTGAMTAAGLATIEMARFVLREGGREDAAWAKRKDAAQVQQAVFDGFAWLQRNWHPVENPEKEHFNIHHGYWWFAIGSAMDLAGIKQVGKHTWYLATGQTLVNRQHADGHWNTKTTMAPMDTLDTCFAVLFLARSGRGLIPHPSVRGGRMEPPKKDPAK